MYDGLSTGITVSRVTGTAANSTTGTWRELLSRRYLGASAVLAGGIALYATNEFLTISLMPSAIAEIGGARFYAWVMTVYLVGSVVAATAVHAVLMRLGPRWSYLLALGVFGGASLVCTLAPAMEVLLVGRVIQGVAGGLLTGLGYAVINTVLPPWLWTKASALVSAMWGVGTLCGPAVGGIFAQLGIWRWAFGMLVVLSLLMALLVPVALPVKVRPDAPDEDDIPIPVRSLILLGAAALAVSVAGIPRHAWATAGLLAVGALIVAVFVMADRRGRATVLPPSAYGAGPLKWIYISIGVLMACTMVTVYIPLFGQRLGQLTPLAAGFLAAAVALGWTIGEVWSASMRNMRFIALLVSAGPLVIAAGLAVMALTQRESAAPGVVAVWLAALLIGGIGVGVAWPHLSAGAMGCVKDPAEGPKAAAAINTVQLICSAFGAGLAGVVVNLTDDGGATAARWLFAVFAALAAGGVVASVRAGRGIASFPVRTAD